MKKLLILTTVASLLLACETEKPAEELTALEMEMGHGMETMSIQSDEDFLAMMIPHHQEAIDTSNIILQYSTNEELKALAQAIVDAQTAEIAQMEAWGADWFGETFQASAGYDPMMSDLSLLEGEDLDQEYIEGMIAHHQGAIAMAEEIQMITERPELLEMADAIIAAQTAEVEMMQAWLK